MPIHLNREDDIRLIDTKPYSEFNPLNFFLGNTIKRMSEATKSLSLLNDITREKGNLKINVMRAKKSIQTLSNHMEVMQDELKKAENELKNIVIFSANYANGYPDIEFFDQ